MRVCCISSLAALLAGCSLTAPAGVPAGRDFELALGESVMVEGSGVTLTFEDVPSDSRCPTDVVCVWAGNAQVRVVVAGAAAGAVELNTSLDPTKAAIDGIELRLVGLAPARFPPALRRRPHTARP
jgi:hypothetical protein